MSKRLDQYRKRLLKGFRIFRRHAYENRRIGARVRYYIDTAIWIDTLEDRRGFHGEYLGRTAGRLLQQIIMQGDEVIISDIVAYEIQKHFSGPELQWILAVLPKHSFVQISVAQRDEARLLAGERHVPEADAAHAIIARDNACILVTRDTHFLALRDICVPHKPEELR
jgi:predicted nucleic acid-binding protein